MQEILTYRTLESGSAMSKKPLGENDIMIAKNMRKLRIASGLTQKAVAEKLDVSSQQYNKYEHYIDRITVGMLYTISEVLDCNIGLFFVKNNSN